MENNEVLEGLDVEQTVSGNDIWGLTVSSGDAVPVQYLGVTDDEVEGSVLQALERFFSDATIGVELKDAGINKDLQSFTTTDVLLLVLVALVLGRAILDIIGGKGWKR